MTPKLNFSVSNLLLNPIFGISIWLTFVNLNKNNEF